MNKTLAGPNQRADWFTAYDWVEAKRCYERQHTGSCNCHRRSKALGEYNPCQRADQVLEDLSALSIGNTPTNFSLGEIVTWVRQHACRSFPRCNHRNCQQAAPILDFLEAQEVALADLAKVG